MKIEAIIPRIHSTVPDRGDSHQKGKVGSKITGAGKAEIAKSDPVQASHTADLREVLSPEEKAMLTTLFGSYQQRSVSYNLQAQPIKEVGIGLKVDTSV
ncbi:MAG: hypothetical protein B1H40_02910 [Candidatus Latescibacteria bacterium 4484_181]|nr:MAG: hypothetical protein B1H40_02910 [Candidatus Latescibacteria bacterium 4484_181]